MRLFRLALFLALCLALAVQGVAQARALASPCGGHGKTSPAQAAQHADHATPGDHAGHAGAPSTASPHDCCDDGDATTPHTCKMGGDCQGQSFVPLLSTPAAVPAAFSVAAPVTRAAQVTVSPLRDRLWRPPAAA